MNKVLVLFRQSRQQPPAWPPGRWRGRGPGRQVESGRGGDEITPKHPHPPHPRTGAVYRRAQTASAIKAALRPGHIAAFVDSRKVLYPEGAELDPPQCDITSGGGSKEGRDPSKRENVRIPPPLANRYFTAMATNRERQVGHMTGFPPAVYPFAFNSIRSHSPFDLLANSSLFGRFGADLPKEMAALWRGRRGSSAHVGELGQYSSVLFVWSVSPEMACSSSLLCQICAVVGLRSQ
ncbi:hypothetical protein COCON_G00180170 [Conger conger]|uniref:Uncharacterized protein n=1 Tax=Conger conger TaxID=82655 RepID=A0A9Q1D516_CONCO|nr:hypothetical protein COCON_G00180170 [Conger conger]